MPQKTPQEIQERAQQIWAKLSSAGRSCVGMGIMPDDDIQVAIEQGFERDDILTALLSFHEKYQRLPIITSGKGRLKGKGSKWRKK